MLSPGSAARARRVPSDGSAQNRRAPCSVDTLRRPEPGGWWNWVHAVRCSAWDGSPAGWSDAGSATFRETIGDGVRQRAPKSPEAFVSNVLNLLDTASLRPDTLDQPDRGPSVPGPEILAKSGLSQSPRGTRLVSDFAQVAPTGWPTLTPTTTSWAWRVHPTWTLMGSETR